MLTFHCYLVPTVLDEVRRDCWDGQYGVRKIFWWYNEEDYIGIKSRRGWKDPLGVGMKETRKVRVTDLA